MQEPPIDQGFMEIAQLVVWASALVVGTFGIVKGLMETRANREARRADREQSARELRWNKADMARQELRRLFDSPHARDAMRMLDWSGRKYTISDGSQATISSEQHEHALRTHELEFEPLEVYVRDCMDELLDGFELLEHYVRIDLVEFEDVSIPLRYHVRKLHALEHILRPYMHQYEFEHAPTFLERFPSWNESLSGDVVPRVVGS